MSVLRSLRYFVSLAILLCFVLMFEWTRERNAKLHSLPSELSSFEVRVEGQCILIRNTSSYTLSAGQLDFEAILDKGQYSGSRHFSSWDPGEEIEIVIAPPQDLGRLKSFEFTGVCSVRAPQSELLARPRLTFSTTLDPPIRIEFVPPAGRNQGLGGV
jgi:hypothetical protein